MGPSNGSGGEQENQAISTPSSLPQVLPCSYFQVLTPPPSLPGHQPQLGKSSAFPDSAQRLQPKQEVKATSSALHPPQQGPPAIAYPWVVSPYPVRSSNNLGALKGILCIKFPGISPPPGTLLMGTPYWAIQLYKAHIQGTSHIVPTLTYSVPELCGQVSLWMLEMQQRTQ